MGGPLAADVAADALDATAVAAIAVVNRMASNFFISTSSGRFAEGRSLRPLEPGQGALTEAERVLTGRQRRALTGWHSRGRQGGLHPRLVPGRVGKAGVHGPHTGIRQDCR